MNDLIIEYLDRTAGILDMNRRDATEWLADPDFADDPVVELDAVERDELLHACGWLRGAADALNLTVAELIDGALN